MICNQELNCTGCTACKSTCPVNAISMQEDEEGFLQPIIDKSLCTNCGLCINVCPVENPKYVNNHKPYCFAVMASDKIRYGSSSGGVFPVLAYHFLEQGGYVAGAVWNSDWGVEHKISNKIEDIEKMRGSKYLQSSMNNCYKETKKILDSGSKVLFTGTPCQIAGLYAYLRKDYENLYTTEIICHGTPSPKVFKKYIEENYEKNLIEEINFRSKKRGWGCGELELKYNNKNLNLKNSEYYEAFLKNIILRKSCTNCSFNKLPRQANLSMADFWGINKFNKKYNDNKGTSVVLVNNNKGNILLKVLKSNTKILKKVPMKYAIRFNPNIVKASELHQSRELFYDNLDRLTVKENSNRIFDDNCDCMVINLWSTCNYGASLTCLGVKSLLKKLGKQTKVINYVPELRRGYKGSFAEDFANKYLNLTKPIKCHDDLLVLNSKCKNFIAGSDQIFNAYVMKTHHSNVTPYIYLLDFVNNKNKKISYAASFGEAQFNGDKKESYLFSHFIHQFDHLSIREDEGIDILKNDFGINNATQLIDGAFHIPHSLLDEMTSKYEKKEKYIACYVLPYYRKNKWYRKYLKYISQELNLPIKELKFNVKTPLEEWLSFIKNAEFVISDSYHAIVFSIIFNIPFLQVKNASQSRFESLFRLLDIENNSIDKFSIFENDKIFAKRDWEKINKKIQEEVLRAEQWMKNALDTPKQKSCNNDFENFVLINQELEKQNNKKIISYFKNKNKYLIKYYFYKIYKNLCFGEKRKTVKEKCKELKEIKRIIKSF